LNYTVQIGYNHTHGIMIDYYPILELQNNVKKIVDKRTILLNGNVTAQFNIMLEQGINTWSLGIKPLNSDIPIIIHHEIFDEIYRDTQNRHFLQKTL